MDFFHLKTSFIDLNLTINLDFALQLFIMILLLELSESPLDPKTGTVTSLSSTLSDSKISH